MKKITLLLAFFMLIVTQTNAQDDFINHLASFTTGPEGSAETVAYSNYYKRAFVTNSTNNSLSFIDLNNPENPTLIQEVSLAAYGAGPNSVDALDKLVAVAVEGEVKQNNGRVIFFDEDGTYLGQVTVGALPDMLTFTPNGEKLLVANEGEPNDDYTNDPEGTVSVIDLTSGVAAATVTSISFSDYNTKKASLLNKGVRIFGPNATVAQDLEPEYITVTADGTLAYVNCQENNALVVIDLSDNSILDILPLGYKNHNSGTPTTALYNINELVANWPELGTPVYDGGQDPVMLGGFSGLYYNPEESTATDYVFYAVPDRGPNAAPVKKNIVSPVVNQNLRPFKLPNYQGRIVKFTFNTVSETITLDDQILLTRQDGTTPITGKGNIPGFDEIPITYSDQSTDYVNIDYADENNEEYHALPYDELGGDFEGVLIDKRGKFWMCDEYRPALYNFEPNGTLIERYVPAGTSQLGTNPQPAGTYGAETLPAVYSKRRANRGFEAIAYDEVADVVYAFIQTPLYNPNSSTKNNSDVIRILGVDATNGNPVSEYIYLLERNKDAGFSESRVDKIGDAVYKGNGKFLVIERDSSTPEDLGGKKYVFEIDINFATNTLGQTYSTELEVMTADDLAAEGVSVVQKLKVLNLPSVGYVSSDKAEGIAVLPDNKIAVLNDNDFGLAGAGITDNSVLGIISFTNDYSLDASDKDDVINIASYPTLGMFMPDAIANYSVNGMNYIVTANEGDARDYDGYSEEDRVEDLTLNPAYYPNAAALQTDETLGRLKTTYANGDYNGDGTYEQIYSYGARSFSIFDKYGNLVFDSANLIAQTVAVEEPELFNQKEGNFDKRSDDKGVEPEAIAIGEVGGKTYAFVGLERQNTIIAFDITDPNNVSFVTYYKGNVEAGDVAPEIIKFIPAENSGNSDNLLLVGYEVSGTLGVLSLDEKSLGLQDFETETANFKLFPVPTKNELNFNKVLNAEVYNINGQLIQKYKQVQSINVENLTEGVYIIKTDKFGSKRFLKM